LILAGCPGPSQTCGAGDVATDGIAGNGVTWNDGFQAGANNDCPAQDGVISLTVFGHQTTPAGAGLINVCVPRPDLIRAGTSYPLVHNPITTDETVQLVDFTASPTADCTWSINDSPDASARFDGFCDDGTAADGFAMTLTGVVHVVESCTGNPDANVDVSVSGAVEVLPQ
jgi:hypothetical protein